MKEVWRYIDGPWRIWHIHRVKHLGSPCLSALLSLAGSFHFMVLNGCWGSSHPVCMPENRNGTKVCLTTSPNTALHFCPVGQHLMLCHMDKKARGWSPLTGHSAQEFSVQGTGAFDTENHLLVSATQIFALIPFLHFFSPAQNLTTKIAVQWALMPPHLLSRPFLSWEWMSGPSCLFCDPQASAKTVKQLHLRHLF